MFNQKKRKNLSFIMILLVCIGLSGCGKTASVHNLLSSEQARQESLDEVEMNKNIEDIADHRVDKIEDNLDIHNKEDVNSNQYKENIEGDKILSNDATDEKQLQGDNSEEGRLYRDMDENTSLDNEEPVDNEIHLNAEEDETSIQRNETNDEEKEENSKYVIVIDAGHQGKGNSEKEPIGPGAKELKAKVTSGTRGVATKVAEYIVNLQVSLKLKRILEEKGYQVVMIRETHDVDISNAERAQIANDYEADAFVRIHCNGSDNPKITGALTMCQTKKNPYCGELYEESSALSKYVIDELCNATGTKNRGVIETDTMSGINWCKVPVTIVEMGYMTNEEEDKLLCDDEYQEKLAQGIASGIELYLHSQE